MFGNTGGMDVDVTEDGAVDEDVEAAEEYGAPWCNIGGNGVLVCGDFEYIAPGGCPGGDVMPPGA